MRFARERCSWRYRRDAPSLHASPALKRSAGAVYRPLAELSHVQRFAHGRPEVQRLLTEAAAGGPRQEALRLFFESAEYALAEMMLEHNAKAPSPHQLDREGFLKMLCDKCATLSRLGDASSVVVVREDSGFFSGFLVVLDVLLFAHPDTELLVNWHLDGNEGHFGYAPERPGGCVWGSLFEPVHRPASEERRRSARATPPYVLCERFNMLLTPRFRWLARGTPCADRQRAAYRRVLDDFVRIRNAEVLRSVDSLGAELRAGVAVGVHKRVWNPGTAEYQGSRALPTIGGFVEATRRAIRRVESRGARRVTHVYLATDDAAAPEAFERAFGSRLRVRRQVTRAGGGLNADGTLNEVRLIPSTLVPARMHACMYARMYVSTLVHAPQSGRRCARACAFATWHACTCTCMCRCTSSRHTTRATSAG